MANWPGGRASAEGWRWIAFNIPTLLFKTARKRDKVWEVLPISGRGNSKHYFGATLNRPCVLSNRNTINKIAVRGLDIWDMTKPTNQNTHMYCRHALSAYAAHTSTQHNNERLVNLGALMASTGKSEIMASVFAIA
jgi:hypothetical protein